MWIFVWTVIALYCPFVCYGAPTTQRAAFEQAEKIAIDAANKAGLGVGSLTVTYTDKSADVVFPTPVIPPPPPTPKTLTAAMFANGVTIDLNGGTTTIAGPITLATTGATLRNGTVIFTAAMNQRALVDRGTNNRITGIKWILGTGNHAAELHGNGFNAGSCTVVQGGGLLYLLGAHNTTATDCSGIADRNFISSWSAGPGLPTDNTNLVIRGCTVTKIAYEHAVRFHCLTGLLIDSCNFSGAGSQENKDPLTLHDGANFVIQNSTISGWTTIDPLEIAGNETKTLVSVAVNNCKFTDRVIVGSGVSGLSMSSCGIAGSNGGCVQVQPPWGKRTKATGSINGCAGTDASKPDAWMTGDGSGIHQSGNTFNGKPA